MSSGTRSAPRRSSCALLFLVLKTFRHTFPDDLDVLLSKGVLTRTVMSDVGTGDDVTGITLNLDEEATNGHLPDDQLVGGRFKSTNVREGSPDEFPQPVPAFGPLSALSRFDGNNPNGLWKLRVVDDARYDCGELARGWSLIIKAKVPTT
jgi:hypothetical protein